METEEKQYAQPDQLDGKQTTTDFRKEILKNSTFSESDVDLTKQISRGSEFGEIVSDISGDRGEKNSSSFNVDEASCNNYVVDMCDEEGNHYDGVPQYILDKLQHGDDDEDDDNDNDNEDKQGSVFEDEDSRDDDIDEDYLEGSGYDEESADGEIDENVREYRRLRHQQICEQLERHRELDRSTGDRSTVPGGAGGRTGGRHPPNRYIKKCKSATFSLDGMMYTIGE